MLSAVRRIHRHRSNGIPRGVVVLAAALLASAVATMAFIYLGNPPRNGPGNSPGGFGRVGGGVLAPGVKLDRRKRSVHRSGLAYWLLGAGGFVVLAGVGTAYWLRNRQSPDDEFADDEVAAQLIGAVVEESLDELRQERDARRVVIACYARMERALSTVGLERSPWEAPLEYLERVLVGLRASEDAVQRLTALFEEAKFSDHVVDERMREDAIGALSAVRRGLRVRATSVLSPSVAAV
ncbi:MAG TPA: DUF4129 domain-containing protein [Gaiellaceae bacterium]